MLHAPTGPVMCNSNGLHLLAVTSAKSYNGFRSLAVVADDNIL